MGCSCALMLDLHMLSSTPRHVREAMMELAHAELADARVTIGVGGVLGQLASKQSPVCCFIL